MVSIEAEARADAATPQVPGVRRADGAPDVEIAQESEFYIGHAGDREAVRQTILDALQPIADAYGARIRLEVPHGDFRPPVEGDRTTADLIIAIWSHPGPDHMRSRFISITRALGVALPYGVQDTAEPSGHPEALSIADDEGVIVAEVLPRTADRPGYLYVLFDLVHREFDGQAAVLQRILDAAMPLALGTPHPFAHFGFPVIPEHPDVVLPSAPMAPTADLADQHRWGAERASFRTAFVEAIAAPFAAAVSPLEERAAAVAATIDGRTAKVRASSSAFEVAEQRSVDAEASVDPARERIAEEFDRILAMPEIEGVAITPEELVVTTKSLTMTDGVRGDHQRYDVGAYRIRIARSARGGDFGFEGVDGVAISASHDRRGRNVAGQLDPHPYLHPQRGGPCWGNLGGLVRDALRAQEYDVVVQLCLTLLTAPLSDNAYEYVRRVLEAVGKPIPKST